MSDSPVPHTFENPSLQAAQNSVLEGLGQLASYFGFSKVVGQLFGALLLSPRPLNLDELMEQLGISKASVSMNLRSLEHMGIVHEVWIKDDRRKYYRPESDFWRILTNVLSSRELRDVNHALRVLQENADAITNAMPEMSGQEYDLAEFYINRLDQLQDFFGLAKLVLTSIIEQAQNQPDVNDIKRLDFE